MKSWIKILFISTFVFTGSSLLAQTAEITQDPFSDEADVRDNSNDIIVTLTGDKFNSGVASNDLDAADFLAGFTGGSSAWNDLISGLDASNISLSAEDSVATISVPAQPSYFIDGSESLSLTIPNASLIGGSDIIATGSISISNQDPAISIATQTYTEQDIRDGSIQFDITLSGDEWENTLTATFKDSIDSDGSGGWDTQIKPNLTVNRISASIVRVTIPQTPSFDITSNEDVTIEVSAANLQHTGSGVFSVAGKKDIDRIDPYMVLSSVPTPITEQLLRGDAVVLKVKLYEVEVDAPFDRFDFSLSTSPTDMTFPANGSLRIDADTDVTSPATDEFEIVMTWDPSGGGITQDHLLGLTINSAAITGGNNLSTSPVIPILSTIVPNITGVSIPNTPYGIGDEIIATVTVNNDGGADFAYASGTIAGRTPSGISRVSSTSYELTIPIIEGSNPQYAGGDNILVTNLQFSNEGENGNLYSTTIIQGNDPIDTEKPVVTLISINNGTYKVGDDVAVIVNAVETGLDFDGIDTRINNVRLNQANVSFAESGGGIYQFTYTVAEGNDDISGTIPVTMVAVDGVGNESDPFTTVSGSPSVIDGHSPVILSVDEPSVGATVTPGNPVQLIVTSTEPGLSLGSGSLVNNEIPSGFTPAGNSYTVTYTVGADDDEVSAGNLSATIILEDAAGNQVTQVNGITNNDVEIVTSEPFATISGGGEMCADGNSTIYLNPSGRAPFTISVLEDGGFYQSFAGINGPFNFDVSPASTVTYTINEVTDGLGITGSSEGSALVTVNPLPTVSITSPPDGARNVPEGTPIDLVAEPEGGVFSGPGVESPANKFHPDIAGIDNNPHTVRYTYTNPTTGCVAEDTIVLTVVDELLNILNLPAVICYNEPPLTINATNDVPPGGDIGYFGLYDSRDIKRQFPLAGIIDFNNNSAQIDPAQLGAGSYVVRFSYLYSIALPFPFPPIQYLYFTEESFSLDQIDPIKFIRVPRADVCNNELSSSLEANLDRPDADYSFTGPGVSGDPVSGFDFFPELAPLGPGQIKYLFISDDGCRDSAYHDIIVYDVPDVDFSPNEICMPLEGGIISFTNETNKTDLVSNWKWEFIEGGTTTTHESTIFESEVSHKFGPPDLHNVRLAITTVDGCFNEYQENILFGDEPVADFRWKNDCYVADSALELINESTTAPGVQFEFFTWNIYEEDASLLASFGTQTKVDTSYLFAQSGKYFIELIAENERGCTDTKYDTLKFKQSVEFGSADGRFMDFNLTDEDWSSISRFNDSSSAWTYGIPDYEGFESPPNDFSWFTDLKEDVVENSWIQSQCFDFRDLERPMIRMDVMRSFDNNRDGAVLQYTTDNGVTWITVGNIGEGINWYNSFNIREEPGGGKDGDGSPIGWAGNEVFNPDTSWTLVAHDLDDLAGEPLVVFGIFYATDGASVVDNQGFAIDNVYIGERTKKALVEHFTNAGDADATEADDDINDFVEANNLDVTSLQYHMHYPEDDPMNLFNPAPASSRSFYYGITEIPYAVMDGGTSEAFMYDFEPGIPTANQLKTLTLESPLFELEVSYKVAVSEQRLSVDLEMSALEDINSSDLVLNVAVVEKLVDYSGGAGATEFKNVVRAMLPSAAGSVYARSWNKLDTQKETFHWYFDTQIDPAELAVVAFLQDEESGKILQVANAESAIWPLQLENMHVKRMRLYPNPTSSTLFVESTESFTASTVIEVMDMTGRRLMVREAMAGERLLRLQTDELIEGTYMIQRRDHGIITGRDTFVKTR